MSLLHWAESTREELRAVLPDALVVLPIGATEQHGPHLATGTDAVLAGTVAELAAARVADVAERDLVLAPRLPFGASDHHLYFGGTLSLSATTATALLIDLARSVTGGGGRRLVIVNGHGGNRGVCHAAAASASASYGLTVAIVHYWELLAPSGDTPIPGHAGEFETAMMLAVRPELVRERRQRPALPDAGGVSGVDVHEPGAWTRIDGYTDQPALAGQAQGSKWLEECVVALSARLVELARLP
ncbi:creatininase family protein [Amycolatopsis nigrescens]|uniref:creatininase family protein n=1 Tax=Amycolatopsis nigrescens TaxID=381445 RepID=UPI000364D0F5|nr:creatininase family protein [Amycolatopsis nigrescens]